VLPKSRNWESSIHKRASNCDVEERGAFSYLTEIHRLHAFATQCRTNRWTRRCLPCPYYELDYLVDASAGAFFRHCLLGVIWPPTKMFGSFSTDFASDRDSIGDSCGAEWCPPRLTFNSALTNQMRRSARLALSRPASYKKISGSSRNGLLVNFR